MKELIEKILTDRAGRVGVSLAAFVAATMNAGMPWTDK